MYSYRYISTEICNGKCVETIEIKRRNDRIIKIVERIIYSRSIRSSQYSTKTQDCSLKYREYRHDLFNNPKGIIQ